MLLKTSYLATNNGKGKRSASSRIHRKTLKVAGQKGISGKRVQIGKRISLGKNQKHFNASFPSTSTLCDNSNDSGLGFDHHESQHIITQYPSNINSQIMTLTKSSSNNTNGSAVYHQSMNTVRYGEITQPTYSSMTPFSRTVHETKNNHSIQFGAGKKIKSVVKKPFMPVKNNTTSHLTLKNETEDTCADDFFSTHVQKNNMNNAVPTTNLAYSNSSNSPSENDSTSPSPELSSPDVKESLSTSVNTVDTPEEIQTTTLTSLQQSNHSSVSHDGSVQLQIITQPEQQHRARYQTEGSRGAVKDKSGNGFPVVKLNGYNKSAVLQVFIGNDVGRVSPHIFYQACKVSGKNSTPCNEVKVDGTMVIEIEIKPENDMTIICDCVGILKERNVDVEHRLGKNNTLASTVTRNKKKSTKCRMIFRTKINEDTDCPEILQICSNTITCTQPPGHPEICKKSIESCSSVGGKELFIIGKNFLKDTKITFIRYDESSRQAKKTWEETVLPDKEYLQQTHLICTIPAYKDEITEPVQVQFYVTSSNKKSEPHTFIYMPLKKYCCSIHHQSPSSLSTSNAFNSSQQQDVSSTLASMTWNVENEQKVSSPENIMPPPLTNATSRKPSFSKSLSDSGTSNETIKSNTNEIQEATTSSPIHQSSSVVSSVKELIYNESTLMNVSGQCFINPSTTSLMNPNQVIGQVPLLEEFQVIHHIKSEQNPDQQQNSSIVLPSSSQNQETSSSTTNEMNSAQQQQVVENFINMICAQVEPTIVQQNNDSIMLNQELIGNNINTNNSVISTDQSGNMISAISSQPMICEQNILSVQLDGSNIIPLHNPLDASISSETAANTTLISNAVSEAAAETQAVVKQMIASVAAEILSENPNETQSSINNFISNTLGTESAQSQTQITNSQQQLQEIIAQELLTPVMIKKEDNDGQPRNVQGALINEITVSNNSSTSNITQPFSPTPDFNLTSMSESDLISFINPSVFI